MVEDDTDKPSTSNVCNFDHVSVRDSQTDSSDDEDEEKVLNNSKPQKYVSNEKTIKQIVVDQVFGDTKNFDKVLFEKGAHFLETNIVVYPNFKCTDDVLFTNQVFFTTGNVENIKLEFNKMVKEDNKKISDEGFFSNQSTVENNLTKNSSVFQRQKPQGKSVEKQENIKEILKQESKETNENVKLNSQEFKILVEKFSNEKRISKGQAQNIFFFANKKENPAQPISSDSQNYSMKFSTSSKIFQRNAQKKNFHSKSQQKFSTSNSSFPKPTNPQNRFSSNRTNQYFANVPKFETVRKFEDNQTFVNDESKTSAKFIPQKPNFPNPSSHEATKVLYTKGSSGFGGNHKCQVKGYGKVTNGQFTVNHVAYVKGLQHNLISVSQLVVDTSNQVVFNEESIISNVETNEVLLKSKRYRDMFTLDIKPIVGEPSVCLISIAASDVSWL
ncbi:uncharacterized protein LOC111908280 [Lactuca sativa]|uniref:uncharacterized protein LOC111908280 n=1 Tax=Lactuca sativa TaxID=4236 RepID=UPI000CD96D55|nr:uncharacterized protein LOC111908280 [Lactuca sativa]